MKLVRKLTLALLLGMSAVLAVAGALRVERELALFDLDTRRDEHLIGRALAAAAAQTWRSQGAPGTEVLVQYADEAHAKVRIRWVSASQETQPDGVRLTPDALARLIQGAEVAQRAVGPDGEEQLLTYVPVVVDGTRVGSIELSESLAEERAYVRRSVLIAVATAGSVAAISGLLAVLLGLWLVGRPAQKLIEQARRVGAGDLSFRVELRGRDELGEIGREMNAMCERLAEANTRLAAETQARLEAQEQLRHADRLTTVGKLAAGIAHELGTPLNVISGRAKAIARGHVAPEELLDSAGVIAAQADRITAIVRQLLDFARRRGPRKAPADLRQLGEQVTAMLRPMAAKRGVELRVEDGPAVVAEVDVAQMQQVLANLVLNGLQACEREGTVVVSCGSAAVRPPADHGGPEATYHRVDVRDSGAGIAPEVRDHVFEPFFTTKPVGEGTGLGLSVSFGIVRDHGGWIAVDSAAGRGSCFSIYLPGGGEPRCPAAS